MVDEKINAADLGRISKKEQREMLNKVLKQLPRLRVTIRTKEGIIRYMYVPDEKTAEDYCKQFGCTIISVRDER